MCRVNSPSHAYAMQKAKAPGSEFNPRTREKRTKKKCCEFVSSLKPSEGVNTQTVNVINVAYRNHQFILAKKQ